MKFIAATAALFAGLAVAAPATNTARNTETVSLTFWAAADNTFEVSVPLDGSSTWIASDLSFTSISASGPYDKSTQCDVFGVDGSHTVLYDDASDVPIGPPQEQTYAVCN